jgi:hypothetical protein
MSIVLLSTLASDFNAKAQHPFGLKSTAKRVRLQLRILNALTDHQAIKVWWVDYNGNAVFYANIPSGGIWQISTFGTHPWLITNTNGDLISSVILNTSNMSVTIE